MKHNTKDGTTDASMFQRQMTTYMGSSILKRFVKASDLGRVMNIVLVHLSGNHSDEARFVDEVVAATGKLVTCARDGLVVDFSFF